MAEQEVGNLAIRLGIDSTGFEQSMSSINRSLRTLGQEMRINQNMGREWGSSLEGLSQRSDTLTRTLAVQDERVRRLRAAYDESVASTGENSAATENLATQLNRATAEFTRTETELNSVNDALQRQRDELRLSESGWTQLGDHMQAVGSQMERVGEGMTKVGKELSTKVTLPLVEFGTGAVAAAKQFDDAQAKIQSALGVTATEAENLGETAKAVWKEGFGESLEEVADTLILVKQNMQNVSDGAELKKVTRDAMLLAKTFDGDVNEVTRAANNLMVNFGIDSGKAFDLMASGAQNGLNFSGELFDNLAEYAPLFADMGYSTEEYFAIMERGAKSGVYNLDYVNDVMKEFQIRIKDNSDATSDAMSGMSQSTLDLWEAQYQGKATVADVAESVIKDLKSMENQVDANEIAVGLFGTKWEDLEADAVYAMLGSRDAMTGFEDSMKSIAEVQEQTFGQRSQAIFRELQAALQPVGEILIGLAENIMPKVSAAIETATNWFKNLSLETQDLIVKIGLVAAAIGPLLVVGGILVSAIGTIVGAFGTVSAAIAAVSTGVAAVSPVVAALAGVFTVLTGPIGIAVAVIAGIAALGLVIYKNWEPIKAFFIDLWASIAEVGASVWESLKEVWASTVQVLTDTWSSVAGFFTDLWSSILTGATSVWDGVIEKWKAVVSFLTDVFSPMIEYFSDLWTTIVTTATDNFETLKEVLSTVWENIKTIAGSAWEIIKNVILGPILLLISLVTGDMEEFNNALSTIWTSISDAAKKIWTTLKDTVSSVVTSLVKVIVDSWTAFKGTFSDLTSSIKETVSGIWEQLKTSISNIISNLVSSVVAKWGELKSSLFNLVTNIVKDALSAWEDLKNSTLNKFNEVKNSVINPLREINLREIGSDIIQGLINGIKGKIEDVKNAVKNVTDAITGKIKDILQIKSPSRVMVEMGGFIGEGLEDGMNNSIASIKNAARSMANAAVPDVGLVTSPNYSGQGGQSVSAGSSATTINQTVVIHSPTAISPSETARLQKRASQELALGW